MGNDRYRPEKGGLKAVSGKAEGNSSAYNDDKRGNCETTEQFPESEWMQPYELTKNREPSESGP